MFTAKKKIAGMIGKVLILALLAMASFAATNNSIKEGGIITPYWMGVNSLFDQTYSISSGYHYKFVTVIKAYKGSTLVDTIYVNSTVKYY